MAFDLATRSVGWVSNPAAVFAGGLKPTTGMIALQTVHGAILQLVGFNPSAKTAAGFETHPTERLSQHLPRMCTSDGV
jgi:hypothetical protein